MYNYRLEYLYLIVKYGNILIMIKIIETSKKPVISLINLSSIFLIYFFQSSDEIYHADILKFVVACGNWMEMEKVFPCEVPIVDSENHL